MRRYKQTASIHGRDAGHSEYSSLLQCHETLDAVSWFVCLITLLIELFVVAKSADANPLPLWVLHIWLECIGIWLTDVSIVVHFLSCLFIFCHVCAIIYTWSFLVMADHCASRLKSYEVIVAYTHGRASAVSETSCLVPFSNFIKDVLHQRWLT